MKNFNASYGTQRPCLLKSPGLRQFALLPCKKAVPFTITQKEKKKKQFRSKSNKACIVLICCNLQNADESNPRPKYMERHIMDWKTFMD